MEVKKIGTIVNTFGIKGQLKVSVSSSTPEVRFKVGNEIHIRDDRGQDETYTISSFFMKNSRIAIISLADYTDINDVESLVGRDIYADVDAPEGTYFYDDLVGMIVISDERERIGEVTNVVKMPAGDYIIVKDLYIPFKLGLFIDKVDIENKTITLTKLGSETCR